MAFFASHDAIGAVGLDRLDVSWNLYLMDTKIPSAATRPVGNHASAGARMESRWSLVDLWRRAVSTWRRNLAVRATHRRDPSPHRGNHAVVGMVARRIAAIQGTYASSGDIEDILMSEVIVFELSAI